jgi:aryl-alcohol dehydrogenase-like predicted oxidoreductase
MLESVHMENRRLGASDLQLSLVGLGTNNFGERIDRKAAEKVLNRALEVGVTHIDTSDTYGNSGGSETIIGQVLGSRRNEFVLATKFGKPVSYSSETKRGRRSYVLSAVEASLKRLRTDHIDLLWMHEPDPSTPMEETFRALEELRQAGKVSHFGASNFSPTQLEGAAAAARQVGIVGFVGTQDEYSLVHRAPEKALLPALEKLGLGLVPYFPLAGGSLSGKYHRHEPRPTDSRHSAGDDYFLDPHWDAIETLRAFAEARGHTLLDLAMSWLASQPTVTSIITGATKPEQIDANAGSIRWKIMGEELAEIDRLTTG